MIFREKDSDYQSALYYDLILDDITLSDFGKTSFRNICKDKKINFIYKYIYIFYKSAYIKIQQQSYN
ncbi:unnamed protein product [Rotaria sp. Silwood2]|nr:unnamed protein product [Rotaria sp. Silwood2]